MNKKEEIIGRLRNKKLKHLSLEEKTKILDFFEKYQDAYEEVFFEFLEDELDTNIYDQEICLVRQAISACGLYKDDSKNPYVAYINEFKKYFSYNQNIVAVATGRYPADALELRKRQESGRITVYEPKLLELSGLDIVLKKEKFSLQTNIDDDSLIFGIMPCEATKIMISKANSEHKNLFLGLCGCSHYNQFELYHQHKMPYNWASDMYDALVKGNEDNCDIEVIDAKEKIPFPILIKKLK